MDGDVLVPPYRRIADAVRDRIARGELRPGDRVPSARQITRDFGVAIATATKALAVLRDEGLTTPRTGVGTVVAAPKAAGPARRERDLDRDRIVRAAIAIADPDGMSEVSMRRIAGDLGVATMSLYRHVPSKDELVLAMIDAAYAEVELPVPGPAGWRAQLELCARVQWAMFHRHPWLAGSMSLTRPQLAPHALRTTEWILQALGEIGLSFPDRMFVHVTLFSFIRGVADALEPEAEAIRETGITNDEWMNQQNARFIALLGEHELPTFRRYADTDFDLDLDSLFEFGLARLLDGLGVFIDSRPR